MPMPIPPANPSAPGAPNLPGAMAGAPPHPGPSPVTAPGAGQGNEAAAVALTKTAMDGLFKALQAFPHGGEKSKAVLSALQSLNKVFSGQEGQSLVPAAIQQLGAAAKGGPLMNTPAPGIAPAPLGGAEKPPMAA